MSTPSDLPPMSPESVDVGATARTCCRCVSPTDWTVICGTDATHHVIWQDMRHYNPPEHGYTCQPHTDEAVTVWSPWSVHELGPWCGMPGSEIHSAWMDDVVTTWCDADPDMRALQAAAVRVEVIATPMPASLGSVDPESEA